MEKHNTDLDVDSLRSPDECETWWRLRRVFLEMHKHKFPLTRLIQLSSCFINNEFDGNTYPAAVMQQLKELTKELPSDIQQLRTDIRDSMKIKFVKSSDNSVGSLQPTTKSRKKNSASYSSKLNDMDRMKSVMTFVKANTEFQSTDIAFQKPENKVVKPFQFDVDQTPNVSLPGKSNFKKSLANFQEAVKDFEVKGKFDYRFGKLSKQLRALQNTNAISRLHLAADKVKVCIDCQISDCPVAINKGQALFVCNVQLDFVEAATGEGLNKKTAKQSAYEEAVKKMSSPYIRVVQLDCGKMELQCSDKPFPAVVNKPKSNKIAFVKSTSEEVESNAECVRSGKKRSHSNSSHGLAEFIVMEPKVPFPGTNGMTILRQSADFSKMLLEYEFRDVGTGVRCRIFIEGQFIMEHFGMTKTNSKTVASEKALDKLRGLCWTIQTKQAVDGEDSDVTREELMGDIQKMNEAISGDNVGNKMLRKMGWTGGGVGKEGNKGIAEPVSVTSIINREGLGLMAERGIEMDFLPKVKTVLMEYARSSNQNDLAFSAQFAKEERAIIHSECRKLGLKSGSKGSGDNRFLIVGRKRTASQLLMHVIHSGGSTSKYDLIPPGQYVKASNSSEDMSEQGD